MSPSLRSSYEQNNKISEKLCLNSEYTTYEIEYLEINRIL